jgi:hypothetical protein
LIPNGIRHQASSIKERRRHQGEEKASGIRHQAFRHQGKREEPSISHPASGEIEGEK